MASAGALVFPRDKSHTTPLPAAECVHDPGCFATGAAWLTPDGRSFPVRSKASNRCQGCARAAAFEDMTMLRMDAEENSAPRFVLTLTSREPVTDSKAYRRACATFWQAFRRRYGAVEYCGFIEWTTGEAPRSGGLRRLHSHWLVKGEQELDVVEVQAWASAEWAKLTGAWVVEFAELRTVGGVVGYLALHHEKLEQRPPAGWTGRRLRPSKGYFAESGERRRARARLWLAQHRAEREAPEWGVAPLPADPPRLVWRGRSWTEIEGQRSSTVLDAPGRSFDSLPERRALDARLTSPDAPIHHDHLQAAVDDHASYVRMANVKRKREAVARWERAARARREVREQEGGAGASS